MSNPLEFDTAVDEKELNAIIASLEINLQELRNAMANNEAENIKAKRAEVINDATAALEEIRRLKKSIKGATYEDHPIRELGTTQTPMVDFLVADVPVVRPDTRISARGITVPKTYSGPNNKLANSLSKIKSLPDDILEVVLDVAKRGAKHPVHTTCVLSYDGDNVRITGRQPFTEFDRCVYNAVTSLYLAGNRVVSPAMIFRAMTGKTDNEKPTEMQIRAVSESINKMRFIRARIDCSEELKMRKIAIDGENVKGGYDDNLLHMSMKWAGTDNGDVIQAYEILSAPVLYEYSARFKQVVSVPMSIVGIKKMSKDGKTPTVYPLEYTEQRITITDYLIRRIEGMKHDNGLGSDCIRLMDYIRDGKEHRGLYTIAGKPELSQPAPEHMTVSEMTKRKNDARYIREDAEAALRYWAAIGYISGYETYKEKRSIAGFKIIL